MTAHERRNARPDGQRRALPWLLLGFGGLLLLGGAGVVIYNQSRGLRNNNPGNIRKSGDPWLGLAAEQPDHEFFTFTEPQFGIRALAKVLMNYRRLYGLNTIDAIIRRWAPPSENDTDAYIRAVASRTGIPAKASLNLPADLDVLVPAIIRHENGAQPYPPELIAQGIGLALA